MAACELRLRGIFGTGFIAFKWQDDGDVEDEILETMRMAVIDLEEIKNILETKIRDYKAETKSYKSMKTLCTNFNKITDTLLNLWRGTHKLQELQTFPSSSFLEHVLKRCYKNIFQGSPHLEVFDKKMFDTIGDIFKRLNMNEDDIFTDIDCGLGLVVLQMSASGLFKYSYGINSPGKLYSESETMVMEFTKWMGFYGKDYTEFHLFREDLLSNEMLTVISESTIIFLKGASFEPKKQNQISLLFSQLKEGTRVVSLENCERLFGSDNKTVELEECEGRHCDTKYFVHMIKCQTKAPVEAERQCVASVAAGAQQKRRHSNGAVLQKRCKGSVVTKEASEPEQLSDACAADATKTSVIASLDKILDCYRTQFIKFIEFMQSPKYRQQLEKAVKNELLKKAELEEKERLLILQMNELNGSSMSLVKNSLTEIDSEVNCNDDLLAEVNKLVFYNRKLKQRETQLNNEIGHLEKVDIVKECQDQLSQLRTKEDTLSTMNRQYLLSKAGEWYGNYLYLSAKVKSLETEVALLEGRKENAVATDVQKSIESFMESFSKKTDKLPVKEEARRLTVSGEDKNASFSHELEMEKHPAIPQRKSSDGERLTLGTERTFTDQPRTEKSVHPLFPLPRTSTMIDQVSLSRSFMPSLAQGAESRWTGLPLFGTAGFSGLAQKRRHGSSSSTDTAESEQELTREAHDSKGSILSSLSCSPIPAKTDGLTSGHQSRIQGFNNSKPGLKEPVSQQPGCKAPQYPTIASLGKSDIAKAGHQLTRDPVAAVGRGKAAASGRRGRKRTATLPPNSGSGSERVAEAGNLDALFLAVSLHHLPPSHRNLSHESMPSTTAMPSRLLREPLQQKARLFSSASSVSQQINSLSVAMATGHSSFTLPSCSLAQRMEFRPPFAHLPPASSASPDEATIDDSHGKHFKKRLHSSNLKQDRDQNNGSTSVQVCESTPILKSLFAKKNTDRKPLVPFPGTSSPWPVDSTSRHQISETRPTTSCSEVTQMSPRDRLDIMTTMAADKAAKCSIPGIQNSTELSHYLNVAQWSDALKMRGVSYYTLPMSSLTKPGFTQQLQQSDMLVGVRSAGPNVLKLLGTPSQRTVASPMVATSLPLSSLPFSAKEDDPRTTESRRTGAP